MAGGGASMSTLRAGRQAGVGKTQVDARFAACLAAHMPVPATAFKLSRPEADRSLAPRFIICYLVPGSAMFGSSARGPLYALVFDRFAGGSKYPRHKSDTFFDIYSEMWSTSLARREEIAVDWTAEPYPRISFDSGRRICWDS